MSEKRVTGEPSVSGERDRKLKLHLLYHVLLITTGVAWAVFLAFTRLFLPEISIIIHWNWIHCLVLVLFLLSLIFLQTTYRKALFPIFWRKLLWGQNLSALALILLVISYLTYPRGSESEILFLLLTLNLVTSTPLPGEEEIPEEAEIERTGNSL